MKNIARSDEAVACLSQSEDLSAFLTIEPRKAFCRLSQIAVYPPAAELFRQGFPAQGIYCIHSGLVKLVNLTPDGKELIVGLRSSGWILGAPAVIIQKPHPVTAVTLMYCHLHYCPGVDFLRFAKLNVEFSKHLLHLYSCEVYDQIRHLVMLGTLTARQRLEQLPPSPPRPPQYRNGQRIQTLSQTTLSIFLQMDETYQRLPGEIQ